MLAMRVNTSASVPEPESVPKQGRTCRFFEAGFRRRSKDCTRNAGSRDRRLGEGEDKQVGGLDTLLLDTRGCQVDKVVEADGDTTAGTRDPAETYDKRGSIRVSGANVDEKILRPTVKQLTQRRDQVGWLCVKVTKAGIVQ